MQPVASTRAGALDPLRLSRLPRFSFLLRAQKSARAVAPNSFLAPNQAFQISSNRHLSQTLELSLMHIKEMGQQSKRTRAPAPREAPPPAPLLTPPPAHLLVPPPAHLLVSPAPKSAPPACIGDSTSPWYMAGNMDYSDPQVWYEFSPLLISTLKRGVIS